MSRNRIISRLGFSQAKCNGVFPSLFLSYSPALKLKLYVDNILRISSWSLSAATCAAVFRPRLMQWYFIFPCSWCPHCPFWSFFRRARGCPWSTGWWTTPRWTPEWLTSIYINLISYIQWIKCHEKQNRVSLYNYFEAFPMSQYAKLSKIVSDALLENVSPQNSMLDLQMIPQRGLWTVCFLALCVLTLNKATRTWYSLLIWLAFLLSLFLLLSRSPLDCNFLTRYYKSMTLCSRL